MSELIEKELQSGSDTVTQEFKKLEVEKDGKDESIFEEGIGFLKSTYKYISDKIHSLYVVRFINKFIEMNNNCNREEWKQVKGNITIILINLGICEAEKYALNAFQIFGK